MATFNDDPWRIIPYFPLKDWIQEVNNLDTRLGYLAWVEHISINRHYTLVVGNIGSFEYEGMINAYQNFYAYKAMSIKNSGRAAGEPVTLLNRAGEVVLEYLPNN